MNNIFTGKIVMIMFGKDENILTVVNNNNIEIEVSVSIETLFKVNDEVAIGLYNSIPIWIKLSE